MSLNKTIQYYNKNAQAYYNKTINVDMSKLYDRFLVYLKECGTIIDIGCGSGRDMKYFADKGYEVEGIDASVEMCRLASSSSLCVENVTIEEWNPRRKYDGIWANASLLHISIPQIDSFFTKAESCLKAGGVIFCSMKSGLENESDAEGRYFCSFSEKSMDEILARHPMFLLCDKWYSDDKMGRGDFRWLHFILKKK